MNISDLPSEALAQIGSHCTLIDHANLRAPSKSMRRADHIAYLKQHDKLAAKALEKGGCWLQIARSARNETAIENIDRIHELRSYGNHWKSIHDFISLFPDSTGDRALAAFSENAINAEERLRSIQHPKAGAETLAVLTPS